MNKDIKRFLWNVLFDLFGNNLEQTSRTDPKHTVGDVQAAYDLMCLDSDKKTLYTRDTFETEFKKKLETF